MAQQSTIGAHPSTDTDKGLLYQIGMGLLSIVVLFVVVGVIVRTVLVTFS